MVQENEETLRLLGVAEDGMRVRRDALNAGMDLIRRIRRHRMTGMELEEAARRANIPAMVGDVDQILRILAGHEAIFDPPAWLSREAEIPRSSDDGQNALSRPRNVRARSQPSAPVHKTRRKREHYTDARPLTLSIFRAAFRGETLPPQDLSEALERAYGNGWDHKTVTTPNGKSMTRRTYGDDLENPDSIIKRGIAHTILLCLKYAEVGDAAFPVDRPVGPNVKKLTLELGLPGRKEEIFRVLLAWGIQVEEPVAAG